jgi:hypothetical protein
MGLTFEKVWAMFQETDREIKEGNRKLQEMIAEMSREADLRRKETDRQFRETDRKIGRLGNRVGELVECLMSPNLLKKFGKRGFSFGKASPKVVFSGPDGSTIAEVDILLENGDTALAVEIKTKLTIDDVADHTERMGKLRQYADAHGDSRKLIGAVAGAIIAEGVKPFAIKNGFYVIEQTGDTAVIAVPDNFVPKEW